MSKRIRQLTGIASAVIMYYLIHEGAHFLYAVCSGVFKKVNFMGIGMQIDVYADKMTDTQLGIFCLVGSIATLIAACGLVLLAGRICRSQSKLFKACMYYITMVMLFLDSVYLSIVCFFFRRWRYEWDFAAGFRSCGTNRIRFFTALKCCIVLETGTTSIYAGISE